MRVAEAARAAAGEDHGLLRPRQVGDQGLAVLGEDLGAERQRELDVGAVRARAVLAHAVGAAGRPEMLAVAVVDQGIELGVDPRDDMAAAAAIAAVRPAARDVLLPPETDAAVAAVAGAHVDLGLIEEAHGAPGGVGSIKQKRGMARHPPFARARARYSAATARRDHRHVRAAAAAGTEPDLTLDEREQRVVAPHADVVAGVPAGAALPDDDVAGDDVLAAELLHAEPLARRIAAVARAAAGLLVRHLVSPRSFGSGDRDVADAQHRLQLPMAAPCADSSCAASS